MKLILRPAIPPWSLIIRKKASSHLAMVPNAETGPLSDVVHPTLISVAVTPGVSSARERRLPATAIIPAAAEPARRERRPIEVMLSSPGYIEPWLRTSRSRWVQAWRKPISQSCVYALAHPRHSGARGARTRNLDIIKLISRFRVRANARPGMTAFKAQSAG